MKEGDEREGERRRTRLRGGGRRSCAIFQSLGVEYSVYHTCTHTRAHSHTLTCPMHLHIRQNAYMCTCTRSVRQNATRSVRQKPTRSRVHHVGPCIRCGRKLARMVEPAPCTLHSAPCTHLMTIGELGSRARWRARLPSSPRHRHPHPHSHAHTL